MTEPWGPPVLKSWEGEDSAKEIEGRKSGKCGLAEPLGQKGQ